MDATWPQRKRMTKKIWKRDSKETQSAKYKYSWMKMEGSTEQSWMEKSGWWSMFHWQ